MPAFSGALPAALAIALFAVVTSSNAGTFTVLHAFTGGADGDNPYGQIIRDAAGNTYGTAVYGANNCTSAVISPGTGCGTVFSYQP